jgi:GNAT superfamily N-acetyltransferase
VASQSSFRRTVPVHELDGLFVEPDHMSAGVRRAPVEDAAARVRSGAEAVEVTTGPAQAFYEKVGFNPIGTAHTRFDPAVRMRGDLQR